LPAWHDSNHVEEEDEQIVRLAGSSRERLFVDDFKVNQPRAVTARVVNYILRSAVAVGPASAKMVAPKLVGAAKFSCRGDQHSPRQRSAIQVLPQTFARQFFGHNAPRARSVGAIAVAIEHFKTANFPALPFLYLAPEPNRNFGHAKIEIGQVG
jgi:hypothetical protein